MVNKKRPRTPCLNCGKEPRSHTYKYCCNACQLEYQFHQYIERWQRGEVMGLQTIGTVSPHIKRFLRKKFENKCCMCGWSEVNPKSGVVPLVADHIDGNWQNNIESNLRLLCPNCDSLTPTFAGLNKGNGRTKRVISNRVKEARVFLRDDQKRRSRTLPYSV